MSLKPSIYLHVGLPKAASTWLQKEVFPVIAPQEFIARESEINALLIDTTFKDSYVKGALSQSVASFSQSSGGGALLSREGLIFRGRAWPGHKKVPTAVTTKRLASELKGARVLLVIRRQRDLLRSAYSEYIRRGGVAKFQNWTNGDATAYEFDPSQYELTKKIEELAASFGRDSVKVVPFELLTRDKLAFMSEIANWLEISPAWDGVALGKKKRNVSLSESGLERLRKWNRLFRKTPENPSPMAPMPFPRLHDQIFQLGEPFFRRAGAVPEPDLKRVCKDFEYQFKTSNRKLQEFTSANLRDLGYLL